MPAKRVTVLCASVIACLFGGVAEASNVGALARSASRTLPLTQRVLHAGQFAGMKPSSPPRVVTGAAAWSQGDRSEAKRMQRLGFVAGVGENLVTPGNKNRYGLSLAEKFSSPAGATSELTNAATTNGPWRHFAVPGIPGARGFEGTNESAGGVNVGFTDGPYYYLVGAGWQDGGSNAVSSQTVIAAARLIYHRVSSG